MTVLEVSVAVLENHSVFLIRPFFNDKIPSFSLNPNIAFFMYREMTHATFDLSVGRVNINKIMSSGAERLGAFK